MLAQHQPSGVEAASAKQEHRAAIGRPKKEMTGRPRGAMWQIQQGEVKDVERLRVWFIFGCKQACKASKYWSALSS